MAPNPILNITLEKSHKSRTHNIKSTVVVWTLRASRRPRLLRLQMKMMFHQLAHANGEDEDKREFSKYRDELSSQYLLLAGNTIFVSDDKLVYLL